MKTPKKNSKNYMFEEKWSPAIAAHGHTSIPNILLWNYKSLGITSPELRMIIALEVSRWDDNDPFPGMDRLSKISGVTQRWAREIITSLDAKGLIIRTEREGTSNTYSFEPLIHKLDQIAVSSLPHRRKEPPRWDETRHEGRMKSSPEEYTTNNTPLLKPNTNTGMESVFDYFYRKQVNNDNSDP